MAAQTTEHTTFKEIERPGVSIEELLDRDSSLPCEMLRFLIVGGLRRAWPCRRPAEFRAISFCGMCDRRWTAFFCARHVRVLIQGRAVCRFCFNPLTYLGQL